jgi:hypothetical protein
MDKVQNKPNSSVQVGSSINVSDLSTGVAVRISARSLLIQTIVVIFLLLQASAWITSHQLPLPPTQFLNHFPLIALAQEAI